MRSSCWCSFTDALAENISVAILAVASLVQSGDRKPLLYTRVPINTRDRQRNRALKVARHHASQHMSTLKSSEKEGRETGKIGTFGGRIWQHMEGTMTEKFRRGGDFSPKDAADTVWTAFRWWIGIRRGILAPSRVLM